MSSSITVWTSPSTINAQFEVARIISATRVERACYDSFSIANCTIAETIEKLNNAFNRLVSMEMSDTTLHIFAVVPIYEKNFFEQITLLYDSCASLEHNITLHILGLAAGISHIFSANKDQNLLVDECNSNVKLLKTLCKQSKFGISYSLIDDYAENGAPIGFSLNSLSRYIALIQTSLMQDYYKVLAPSLLVAHPGDNLSIGVASLSFNRPATVRQMLGLGFIEALDNVGINENVVDAQKAAHEAEQFLKGINKRYPNLYNNFIRPLYKDKGLEEGHIVANVPPILDDDISKLKSEILSLLKGNSLTFPEKEAILALILGRDNENIRGMQYEHEGALLDDACEQPINLYVEAFNNCCSDSGLLPLRGDYEALKEFYWDDAKKRYVESPENLKAINPIAEIKRLKQEIINNTSYIRDKRDELVCLEKSEQQRKDVEEIKIKWDKPQDLFKDIEYKQQPLDDKYIPSSDVKVKKAVDLRKFFTPAKNQKNLGACTSFAAAAMYEALMNQSGVEGSNEMSPAYLYYYSNILKGRPEGGSNFFEQFEVLGKQGVCHQNLYGYNPKSPEIKPSDEADEDAKKHRLISAKQIVLEHGYDKLDNIKKNHKSLTSALSEGYPIGISLKIFDNLGRNGAFILHPADAPNAKEDGWHAMVIVGYSEENNFYIVRNSWGSNFGEKGYCYIPTAYIDDPDYLNFACIITEISDNPTKQKAEVPTTIANFAATETEIRMAAIRNAIAKVRVELNWIEEQYAEYYKYYQNLMMQLTMPTVQNGIRMAAETEQLYECDDLINKKKELEDSFVEKIDKYKKSLRKTIICMLLVTIVLGNCFYYGRSSLAFILFVISAIISVLTILGFKWWIRIKRRTLQKEIEDIAVRAKHMKDQFHEMQIRFHVAGMWLSRFHKLSLEIENVYDRLVSYNKCLRGWRDLYSSQITDLNVAEGQMFKVLDASSNLNKYFQDNKEVILKNVDLIKLFDNFRVEPDNIEEYHQQLKETITVVIESLMKDFNIVNYLLGDVYPYLSPCNIQEEFSSLINVGMPSYRNREMNATSPVRILFVEVNYNRVKQWNSQASTLFPMSPIQISHNDPTSLILITIHPQIIEM